jgi:hypothetical protein
MLLSPEEKEEMRRDGLDPKRAAAFRAAPKTHDPIPLDEYLRFLRDLQILFSPFTPSRRPTPTRLNKL